MTTYWYYNMGSIMYNNNVTLMPFWMASILFFHFSLKTGYYRYWILTGISLGFAFNCKYTAVILALAMVLYLILERRVRSAWKTPGPWLTIGMALLLFYLI